MDTPRADHVFYLYSDRFHYNIDFRERKIWGKKYLPAEINIVGLTKEGLENNARVLSC